MRFNCVIILCVNDENRYRWHSMTPKEIKAAVRVLDFLVHCGKCDKYLIRIEGEIGHGF